MENKLTFSYVAKRAVDVFNSCENSKQLNVAQQYIKILADKYFKQTLKIEFILNDDFDKIEKMSALITHLLVTDMTVYKLDHVQLLAAIYTPDLPRVFEKYR